MSEIAQVLFYGIVTGSIVAIGAIGFTLIFGILNFFNIAYAEYLSATPYLVLTMAGITSSLVLSLLLGIIFVVVMSVVIDWGIFRKFRDRSPFTLLVVSIGISFSLRNAIHIIFGSQQQLLDFGIPGQTTLFGVQMTYQKVSILVTALIVMGLVFLLLNRTDIGIAMRATSENKALTKVRGISPERVIMYVTVVSGAVAALAGLLAGVNSSISPVMGFQLIVTIIAAIIIGGVGDPRGAVAAGLGIGIIQEMSTLVIEPTYKPAIALLLVIVGIAFKPEGLFGKATRV